MAQGYNSFLISRLYKTDDTEEAKDLLEEISEILDPVFIYPIKDAFYRFKNTYISHYFLAALEDFKDKEALKVTIDIFNSTDIEESDKPWCFPVFQKHNYQTQKIIDWAIGRIEEFALESEDSEIDFSYILEYLKKVDKLSLATPSIKKVVMANSIRRSIRNTAMGFFIRINPTETFKFLAQEYPKIADKDHNLEIIISNNVANWHGGTVDSLKKIIKEKGFPRAKEIIKKAEKKKAEDEAMEEKKSKRKESEFYQNTGLITTISELRRSINFISRERLNINFDVFNQNELLLTQNEVAKDEASLRNNCSNLRSIISDTASETKDHGLGLEKMKDLFPGTTKSDCNKSLNSLFFFLKSNGINIDTNLFQLRELYNVCGLISSHPEEKEDLIKLLRELRMTTLYSKGEWDKLHTILLKKYRDCLKKLHDEIFKHK